MSTNKGVLYVVATPIGNLSDLTQRALTILHDVDIIAAEDTRHSHYLLQHYGIQTPLLALHEHNEARVAQRLLTQLQQNKAIALISDAGTPLISDPGAKLVQLLHQNQIKIVPIPGASALITALSVAGFSADKFIFEGFMPAKASARLQRLQQLQHETRTQVYYEAPHRIEACIQAMNQVFGAQRPVALIKELTKCYETIYHAPLAQVLTWLQQDPAHQKGEFVIVVSGAPPLDKHQLNPEAERVFNLLQQKLSLKDASQLGHAITGVSKKLLYQHGLNQVDQNSV